MPAAGGLDRNLRQALRAILRRRHGRRRFLLLLQLQAKQTARHVLDGRVNILLLLKHIGDGLHALHEVLTPDKLLQPIKMELGAVWFCLTQRLDGVDDGGFVLIWLYAQPWFMNLSLFGSNMRDLFQVHTINLSVAIWVGFLALFGIASDNGVVIATYLRQSFAARAVRTVEDIRAATVEGAVRRIRPCLMTSATTILALIPVLTSTGRGSDIMVPMAIPSFGGMLVVLVSVFVVPVLYCVIEEFRLQIKLGRGNADD